MTTHLINPKTTHPKLRLVGLLMATALVATACGGGGGGDAAPPAGSPPAGGPPAGSPPAASDVATLADVKACPQVASGVSNTTWYTNCLVGKRLVGKDIISGKACELRLKANGVFEYAIEGGATYTTAPFSQWQSPSGFYANELNVSAGNFTLFKASLRGGVINTTTGKFDSYNFAIDIKDNTLFPDNAGFNEDKVEFYLTDGRTVENCKLNNI
jgi:hypothetical protein